MKLKSILLAIGLTIISALTGCMSLDSGMTPQEQANFDYNFSHMTPAERIAYMNFLSQTIRATMPQSYDVTVHNYDY